MIRPVGPKEPQQPMKSSGLKKGAERTQEIRVPTLSSKASLKDKKYEKQSQQEAGRSAAVATVALRTNRILLSPLERLRKLREMALPKQPLKSERKHTVTVGAKKSRIPLPQAPWKKSG